MSAIGTVERALQLAQSGTCRSLGDLRKALNKERHESVEQHLSSFSLKRQLLAIMKQAAAEPAS